MTGDESPIVPTSGFRWRVTVELVGAEVPFQRSVVATGWDARSAVAQAAATPLVFWRDPEATAYEGGDGCPECGAPMVWSNRDDTDGVCGAECKKEQRSLS